MHNRPSTRADLVRSIAAVHAPRGGALLPILHQVQEEFGWIDDADLPVIADVLNWSIADVRGVVSFYSDFRRTPPPPHTIRVCRGEACQAVGAQALLVAVRDAAEQGTQVGDVFCLGNCALGPSALVNGRLVGRAEPESILAMTREAT